MISPMRGGWTESGGEGEVEGVSRMIIVLLLTQLTIIA